MDQKVEPAEQFEGRGRTRLSSVAMAMRLLKEFSGNEVEIGISALAKRLGIAKSSAHRLAVTLMHEGLLEQNPETERYRLGVELFALGTIVRRRMTLSTEARPYLIELREQTNETALLGITVNSEIMYVYNMESRQPIRLRSDIGIRRPAFCTAVGRAIYAYKPAGAVKQMLASGLEARTEKTVVDPVEIERMLEEVRRHGFAIEDEECEFGIRCIAAPVRDIAGQVVGAMGIGGPSQRLSLDQLRSFAGPLVGATQAVSARLGYQPEVGL